MRQERRSKLCIPQVSGSNQEFFTRHRGFFRTIFHQGNHTIGNLVLIRLQNWKEAAQNISQERHSLVKLKYLDLERFVFGIHGSICDSWGFSQKKDALICRVDMGLLLQWWLQQ